MEYPIDEAAERDRGGRPARGARPAALQRTVRLRNRHTRCSRWRPASAAGCGADEEGEPPIPASSASELDGQLDSSPAPLGLRRRRLRRHHGGDDPNPARRGDRLVCPTTSTRDVRERAPAELRPPVRADRARSARRSRTQTETETDDDGDRADTETTDTTETHRHDRDRCRRRRSRRRPLPPTETMPPEPAAGRRRQRRRRRPGGRPVSPPTEIAGRYRIDRRLGAGGMSTVFLATDSVLERAVAIKLLAEHLAEDEDFVARFRREALSAARLQHPNIVQVFDSGQDPDSQRHYIVMEYVDGPSAADLLREHKLLDIEQTVQHRARRLPRARLRPPRRSGAPRRQAGQPAALRGDRHHQARRLRHRKGGRADAHHPGRLRARHRRLPVAGAGARRGGRPGFGHLLARRVRLPVPDRPAAARVHVADRAGAQAAAGARAADHGPPARGAAASSTRRSGSASSASPGARYRSALELAEAIEAGVHGHTTERHAAHRR